MRNQTGSPPESAANQSDGDLFPCPICGGTFAVAGMDQCGVCKKCAGATPAGPRPSVASKTPAAPSPRDAAKTNQSARVIPWPIIITVLIVLGVLGVGGTCWWIVRSSNMEMEQRQQIATLKEQGDTDLKAGRYEDASAKYGEAIATATRLRIEDDSFGNVAEARKSQSIAQATAAKAKELQEAKAAKEQQQRKVAAYKAFALSTGEFYLSIGKFVHADAEFRNINVFDLKTARQAMDARKDMDDKYDEACKHATEADAALSQVPPEFPELRQLGQEIQKAASVLTSNQKQLQDSYLATLHVEMGALQGRAVDPEEKDRAKQYDPLLVSLEDAAISIHKAFSKLLAVVATDSEPQQPQARSESPQPASETQRAEVRKLLLEYARNQRDSDEARAQAVGHLAAAKAARESGRTDEAKATLAQAQTANERAKSTAEAMGRLVPQIEPYGEPLFEAVRRSLVSDNAVDARDREVLAKVRLFNSPAFEAAMAASADNASPNGCSDAQVAYERGMALLLGKNVEKNPTIALAWFRRASELGNAAAATQVGESIWNGIDGNQGEQEAVTWFRKGAEGGDVPAMRWLGICYQHGKGVARDFSEALRWYRTPADKGDLEAMHNLAVMYLQGDGVPQSDEEGCKLLRRAAEGGNTMSMEVLGQVVAKKQRGAISRKPEDRERALQLWREGSRYLKGDGVPQDADRALNSFREAASLGHAHAMWALGSAYAEGNIVPRNAPQAVRWYRASIDAGNSLSMVDLAVLLENGNDVPKNETEAANLYRKAAEQGYPVAMCNMGGAYLRGMGVPQDNSQAFRWYQESALHGDTDAMLMVAKMWAEGKGVAPNEAEAEKWVRYAAELGNSQAKRLINNSGSEGTQ